MRLATTALTAFGAALLCAVTMGSAHAAGAWVDVDNKAACQVWNDNPQLDEEVIWSGQCLNGRVEGQGTMTWRYTEDGLSRRALYQGSYKDGREHGRGVFNWPSGDLYEGMWREGRLHGEGKFTFSDGRFCEGVWQFGALRAGSGHDGQRVRRCRIDGRGLHWLEQ